MVIRHCLSAKGRCIGNRSRTQGRSPLLSNVDPRSVISTDLFHLILYATVQLFQSGWTRSTQKFHIKAKFNTDIQMWSSAQGPWELVTKVSGMPSESIFWFYVFNYLSNSMQFLIFCRSCWLSPSWSYVHMYVSQSYCKWKHQTPDFALFPRQRCGGVEGEAQN